MHEVVHSNITVLPALYHIIPPPTVIPVDLGVLTPSPNPLIIGGYFLVKTFTLSVYMRLACETLASPRC